jgi:hypothetical protein
MAWLLTDSEFDQAHDAVRRGDITEPLYGFLWRLVAATARSRLLASALSPTGRWDDDAAAEVLQGWLEGSLLRGGLLRAYDRSATSQQLSRYLDAALHNWLRSAARAKHRPRLLQRARQILRDEPAFRDFEPSTRWLDTLWGMADWADPPVFQGTDEPLIAAAYALPVELVRFSAKSDRADPVISNDDLLRLLKQLFATARSLVSLRQIDRVIRVRFAHAYVTEVDPDLVAEPAAPEPAVLDDMVAADTAREILERLTRRQLEMLRGRAQGATLEQLAESADCSRGTADNELRRAAAIIREAVADDADIDTVLEKLLEMTSMEGTA